MPVNYEFFQCGWWKKAEFLVTCECQPPADLWKWVIPVPCSGTNWLSGLRAPPVCWPPLQHCIRGTLVTSASPSSLLFPRLKSQVNAGLPRLPPGTQLRNTGLGTEAAPCFPFLLHRYLCLRPSVLKIMFIYFRWNFMAILGKNINTLLLNLGWDLPSNTKNKKYFRKQSGWEHFSTFFYEVSITWYPN